MRFLSLSLFATVACAVFAGALPAEPKARDVVQLDARAQTLSEILTTATSGLTVVKKNVDAMTPATADAGAVNENIAQVKSILSDTVVSVRGIGVGPINVDLQGLGGLVAGIVALVAQILYVVVSLVGRGVLNADVTDIGGLLSTVLGLVFALAPGLLGLVVVLLGGVGQLLRSLGLLQVLRVLGL